MRDGQTYPRNTALAVLLLGNYGAGKSNLCLDFPDPYIVDTDQNLRNALDRHPGKRFWFDCPEFDVDDKGVITKRYDEHERWPRMEQLIKENAPRPEVKTLVVDGLGRVTDYLKAYLVHIGSQAEKPLVVGGLKVMTQGLWLPYSDLLKRFVFLCRSYGKPFILTAHIKVDENELSAVKEQRVDLQGQLASSFGKLFTDVWCAEAVPHSDAKYKVSSNGVRYFIRTAPTHRMALKQSCGLPAEFDAGDQCLKDLLVKLTPAT